MTTWQPPTSLPDLRRVGIIALDTETKDDRLAADMGSGWPFAAGYICGVSVAWRVGETIHANYFPLRHPDSSNFDPAQVFRWLRDLVISDVRIVTQNGLYDWGWLRTEAGVLMPPAERLEEIGALATIIDENRYQYSLEELCKWRGLPGKDMALLEQGAAAIGLPKKADPRAHIWQMPACYVGPYAEQDAASTLALLENLNLELDREGTRDAYRLEVDLLPMVHEMRRRGVRIDVAAAERARDLLLHRRDAALTELSAKLGANVSMAEIASKRWLAETFDQHGIKYPHTKKGNPSFTAGRNGWMKTHPHRLPQLITKTNKYNKAAVDSLEGHILRHVVNGRIHAEVHPHRSDDGGTRSLRFSYSDPPLQQMAARDEEIAPLIRGCFLPEEGEVWAKPDISQQEFRFVTHYAVKFGLRRAQEAADRYRTDPNADFHVMVAEMTGLDRSRAKDSNFAKIFGAGVRKFAAMIGKPESEAAAIMDQYDRALPFVRRLSNRCEYLATSQGYIELYDGARRHWDQWMPPVAWGKGTLAPCSREEAERRIKDPDHAWYRCGPLRRIDTHKALNALIQGSAARHTKRWMRAVWREGIVPLLQMHDCLDCSVSSPEQAELVANLGREAVSLEVPIQVDLKYGRNWADATHTWEELHNGTSTIMSEKTPTALEVMSEISTAPEMVPAIDDDLHDDLGDDPNDAELPGSELAPTDLPRSAIPAGAVAAAYGDAPLEFAPPPSTDFDTLQTTPEAKEAVKNGRAGNGAGADTRPPWTTLTITEVPPGSAEFETIVAALSAEDRAMVRLSKPNDGSAPVSAAAGDGRDQRAQRYNGSGTEGTKIYCPFHDDSTPSLHIYNDEDDPHYHCFGCHAHGPLSDLPADWITPTSPTRADDAETLAYAHRLWQQARPIAGTLAAQYLAAVRGIDIDALPPGIDTVLRFHPTCPFNGGRHPCLLALFRDVETDEPAGIHRIALTPEAQKIERRMLGHWLRPRAIKLWPLIRLEAAAKPLYLGEGTETTLAAATRLKDRGRPMWPAWAAGSSGNIKKFPIVPGVEELILLVDRDPSGEDAVAVCRQTWKASGRRVRRLRTQDAELNDFNDLLRAKLRAVS